VVKENGTTEHTEWGRRIFAAVFIILAAALYFAGQKKNPPGFYADESSIAWNALSIARTGADEHGVRFPLFFRAFGEYKNPVYIYALAATLKFVRPSVLVARRFSALLGFCAALAMAWLAWSIAQRHFVAAIVFAMTLFTPNLFEIGRLVFEVALYPLILALFLIAAHTAFRRERWSAAVVVSLLATLTLLTFTYSIGRLQAPLLLATLAIFAFTGERRTPIVILVVAYIAFAIVPLVVFNQTHDGALTARAHDVMYASQYSGRPLALAGRFVREWLVNLDPVRYSLFGDPIPRHHVEHSGGSMLMIAPLLAVITIARRKVDRWWLFVIASALLSVIPCALTLDRFHSLRIVAYPIFLITLSIPALEFLLASNKARIALALILGIGVAQFVWFYSVFRRDGEKRARWFDVGFHETLDNVLDANAPRPIAVGWGDYAAAYWFGAVRGVEPSQFLVYLDPPSTPNTTIIVYRRPPCDHCRVIGNHANYTAYITPK
jgi:hypothetical protein